MHVPREQRLEEQRLLAHPQRAQRRRRLRKSTGAGKVAPSERGTTQLMVGGEREGEGTSPAASPTTKRQSSAAPKRRSSGAWRSLCASSESRTICTTCKRVASGCSFSLLAAPREGAWGCAPAGYCCYTTAAAATATLAVTAAAAHRTCSGGSRGSLALSSSGPASACSSPSPRTSSPRCPSPAYSPC